MQSKTIRIGGGSAFFDDSMDGFPAMLAAGVDYIVFDCLAEVTMSYLARDIAGNPQGFTPQLVAMITVDHDTREGVEVFLKEQVCAISAMAPGTAMSLVNNRGTGVTPLMRVFSFLIPKRELRVSVTLEGESWEVPIAPGQPFSPSALKRPAELPAPTDALDNCAVPLVSLAWARSGDKGDLFNVGAFARRPDYAPYIAAALTKDAVAHWFSHFLEDPAHPRVDRYLLPGSHGINFIVHDSLGGGGSISHRLDRLAKGMAQILLEFPVPVSPAIAAELSTQRIAAG